MLLNVAQWAGKSIDPRVALQAGRSEFTNLAQAKFGGFINSPHQLTDTELLGGSLTTSNYDVLFAQSTKYA